ncbi:unnamed protein product [Parnassius apollo]|uniref:(apollo) hypothetical protein n=1 Tax=Parnassius apollo TaxID=110799 RepID=A0A8S3X727_PARAO|nr:unnamed protein product [Parnassius apollo]
MLSGIKLADGYTRTTGDTMLGLVNAFSPDDNLARDTEYHRQVWIAGACAPSGTDGADAELMLLHRPRNKLDSSFESCRILYPALTESRLRLLDSESMLRCTLFTEKLAKVPELLPPSTGKGFPIGDIHTMKCLPECITPT